MSMAILSRATRDKLCSLAQLHLQNLAELDAPSAGMFLWIKCLGVPNTHDMIKLRAVEKKVLFVPGSSFSVDPDRPSANVRVSYSLASNE